MSREHSVKVPPASWMLERIEMGEWERFYRQALGLSEWDPTNDDLDAWMVFGSLRSRSRRYLARKRRERRWSGVCFTVAVACIVVITERVTG